MRTIQLLKDMQSCVTQSQKTIPAGTIMHKYFTQLTWTYFKDDNDNTLIIMGFNSPDWEKVKEVSN